MHVAEARDLAKHWVRESPARAHGFRGAYTAGSTNWLSSESDLPPTSDLDIVVVVDDSRFASDRRKFMWQDVLLDVSYLPSHRIQSPASILGDYRIAASFSSATILQDPSGHLAALLTDVCRGYAKREWIRRRCADARENVLHHLYAMQESASLHDQVMAWLFGAGVTTHVLLTAGLRNPTIRTRYLAVRQLLIDYGSEPFYEKLLEILGVANWDRNQIGRHLATLTDIFDRAIVSRRSPCSFAADMSTSGRAVAIDGSRELIESGFHREAIFWIAVSHSRCQKVISDHAPSELTQAFRDSYLGLVDDLRLRSAAQRRQRRAEVESILPIVQDLAEVIAANVAE
jgi:hypothetical protein